MSTIRRLIAHVDDSSRSDERLRIALGLARRLGADPASPAGAVPDVAALYAVAPTPSIAYLTAEAATMTARLVLDAEEAARRAAEARVRSVAQAAGAEVGIGFGRGEPHLALAAASRCADLLVVGQHAPDDDAHTGARLPERLVVTSACPLLFVPSVDWRAGLARGAESVEVGQRILVAWADTRESARALRDALPLLRTAEAVDVVRFVTASAAGTDEGAQSGLEEVVAHMHRHGVPARATVRYNRPASIQERLQSAWIPDTPIAEALLSQAADLDADLIVMGGYGHPRAWELLLGGVTRTLLQTMTVPVLMSH